MLVFPGGGYQFCSDREAEPVALAYLAHGFNAFVLRYSVGSDMCWERSFEDAIAALQYLRKHFRELHIAENQIAVVGFSAGGHLASALGTMSEEKPDALILGYAVTLEEMGAGCGKAIPDTCIHVMEDTPNTFLFATSDDNVVPVINTLRFAEALAEQDIHFELHVYPVGEHGFSLGTAAVANNAPGAVNPDAQSWLPDSVRFLHHVFGDFPVGGCAQSGDMPDYRTASLDVPLKHLLKREICVKAIESVPPGVPAMAQKTPMTLGLSFRQLAVYSPELITPEKLEQLKMAFRSCNE